MKKEKEGRRRTYRMQHRARAAEETAVRILEAARFVLRRQPYDLATLQAIAGRAGVSMQTVLRRFGSKEQLVCAVLERDRAEVEARWVLVPPGDIATAVQALLAHYEQFGDTMIRNLRLEERLPDIGPLIAAGRELHERWATHAFGPYLPAPSEPAYARRLALFMAATDVCLWKLLRRDRGLSPGETERAVVALLEGLVATR